MASYLTIPDLVESEPLLSVTPTSDHLTFTVIIAAGETLVRLMHASQIGQHLPLVVLTTDSQVIALDSVYITAVSVSGESAEVTFAAQEVRFI